MDLTLLPSLLHLAAVKAAQIIFNGDFILFFKKLVLIDKNILDNPLRINRIQERWINQRKKKSRSKVFKLLPKPLQKRIIQLFQPLINEINYWLRDHFYIIKRIDETQFMNCLCWNSEGAIDRTKTAERLIRDESIDKRVRFIMACIYLLQNDILYLWLTMTADERQSILYMDSNIAVQFFIGWWSKEDQFPSTRCIAKFFHSASHQIMSLYCSQRSRIRLSSFFSELEPWNREESISDYYPLHAHADDLRLCYTLLEEEELENIFHGSLLTRDLLCSFLDWPAQTRFIGVVNQVRNCLEPDSYEYLLRYIVTKKLMKGVQDVDYQQLLKDLWSQTPDAYKVKIQRERTFVYVRAAMSYDEKTHPLTIQELLVKCSLFTDTLYQRVRDDKSSWMYYIHSIED